jgi:hypothetical protein
MEAFPMPAKELLASLAAGTNPGASGILLL